MFCLPVLSRSFAQSIKSWLLFLYGFLFRNRREKMYNVAFVLLRVADMYRQDGGSSVATKLGQGGGLGPVQAGKTGLDVSARCGRQGNARNRSKWRAEATRRLLSGACGLGGRGGMR